MYHSTQEKAVYGIVAAAYALLNVGFVAALYYAPWDLKLTTVLVGIDVVCGWLMVRYACWAWKMKSRKAGIGILIEHVAAFWGICLLIGVLAFIVTRLKVWIG